jgi:hypothetical protein
MASTFLEKRQFPRFRHKLPLRYQIRGNPDFTNTVVDDISVGGLGFGTENFIAPKTPIFLELNILSRVINAIGEVCWSSPVRHSDRYKIGARFLEFDPKEKEYLSDYLSLQLSQP